MFLLIKLGTADKAENYTTEFFKEFFSGFYDITDVLCVVVGMLAKY